MGGRKKVHHENPGFRFPVVYSDHYGVKFCGLQRLHPFDAAKGANIMRLLKEGSFMAEGQTHKPEEISETDLRKVHTERYLDSLKWSLNVAKIAEIPPLAAVPNYFVQRGYLRPMRFQTAGSILAGKLALQEGWAINLGGGFHHCSADDGGGFCAYADITLLINLVLTEENSVSKVMIVDLDAHQGNGHERDFMDDNRVFIMDMYNAMIYPKDHNAKLAIKCAVELQPKTPDESYLRKLRINLQNSLEKFNPDLIVFNAGTDILANDPLGLLSISPEGVIERDEYVFSTAVSKHIPIVMLLSGGYLKASAKVIADSIMNLKLKGLLPVKM
ncbi:histone deacetylase 11-like [Hermetia illucens]|nr:histone deacetylase 11-like [Hermetia illucens]